jgi:glycosyltransferase involved in cell wall biosynthesis
MELTILMPCLNEAATVESCIRKASDYLEKRQIIGEILIADNGSTDGSQSLAKAAGARVVQVTRQGYGAALIGGIEAARGRYVVMADADGSYDLANLDEFIACLRSGFKLVVGDRFSGGVKPGAMPWLNRYIGNPVLSYIGRRLFSSSVHDFHCGIRGFDREAILELRLRASGMEFASEMIVKASLAQMKIAEVPTTLSPDGRRGAPHLRPWRDGWRHLSLMLMRSPQWLFVYPGLAMAALGMIAGAFLVRGPVRLPGLFTLDINALLYFAICAILGVQIIFFGLLAAVAARKMGIRIVQGIEVHLLRWASLQGAIGIGALLVVTGIGGALYAILQWEYSSFGPLVPSEMMRITIPSVAILAIGVQIIFGSFLLGFMETD